MRLVPAIILAVAIVLAPIGWLVTTYLLRGEEAIAGGSNVDSQARIDIVKMQLQIEALQGMIEQLETRILSMPRQNAAIRAPQGQQEDFQGGGLDYAQVVLIADRTNANKGLTVPTPNFLEGFLGRPRPDLTDNCQGMTNETLRNMLRRENVGPIEVNMLAPAVESLRTVFERVRNTDVTLHDRIRSSGSLCVRQIRGTTGRLSSHSFGLALDINIDGQLDRFSDGKTQVGLTIMKDFFKEEGWIWGAGFRREDSMHFEVSREKLEEWRAQGKI